MSEMVRPNPAQEIAGQLAQLRKIWVDAFNQRDIERLASFYSDDAVMLPPNGDPAAKGATAVRNLLKKLFDSSVVGLRITQRQVEYTGSLAVEISTYSLKITSQQNAQRTETGRLVTTWRRGQNGEFQITVSVWSSLTPS